LFDPGNYNAKLMVIGQSVFGKKKMSFHSFRREAGEPMLDLLRRAARDTDTSGAAWTVSMPAGSCHLRELIFPFNDLAKIKAVLDHELARVLPFSLKGAEVRLVSHWPNARGGRGVLVAVVPANTIAALKDDFKQAGLFLESIVTEYESVSALFLSSPTHDRGQTATLVDLGENQTLICTFADGRLRYARCLTLGLGNIRQGMPTTDRGPEELLADEFEGISHLPAARFLESLSRELHLSLTVSGEAVQGTVETLYLSGGGADIHGISAYFEEITGAEVHNWQELLLPVISEQLASPTAPARRYWSPAIVSGLASLSINVALQSHFKSSMVKEHLDPRVMAVMVLLLLNLTVVLYGSKLLIEARRSRIVNAALEERFKKNLERDFPHAVGKDKPLNYLRKPLSQMRSGKQMLNSLPEKLLDIVKELTTMLPGSPDLILESLTTGGDIVTLKGRTPSYGLLEQLKAKVEESAAFTRVTVQSATKIRENSKNEVGFELEMEVAR
jgi:Tfp pilus assembly PilM family ATPase